MQRDSETRVLILPPTVRDGEITCSLLARAGLAGTACPNLRSLTAELDAGVGALLLTDEAFVAPGFPELIAKLDEQASWSDIPVVILMQGERDSAAHVVALRALRNVTVLERPAPTRSVVSAVQAAVRGRLRQYLMRAHFEQLREVQDRFEAQANFIPHLAWMARPDGWIFWYNRRWYEYTGATPEEMEGWGWQRVHDPEVLPKVMAEWQACLQSGEPFDMTFPLRSADGEFRPFWTRVMPFRDETGQIVLWFGTNTDVTEQRRMMEEREMLLASERAARTEAEQAGRLKDEFLASLSHELRTPLNAIMGWSQILRRQHRENVELEEGLSIIERNARAQAQLIEDLLDMSRIISGKLRLDVQPVNLADILNAAIDSVVPAAEARQIQLRRTLDPNLGFVRGDPARLQQVAWNLLSNAIKFTPAGGCVEASLQRARNHVEFRVADTGMGIKPEFLPYVFERFRQADASSTRSYRGLGLGLAIVKSIVELHGGQVRATSPGEGRGATFTVELPVMALRPSESAGGSGRPREGRADSLLDSFCDVEVLRGVSVLVVDDEEDARNLISRVLEECKARVMKASSAAEGREVLMRERPAVVISDIGMPYEDGYEFIRKVRQLSEKEGGQTPAAALTAFARSEDRTRALRAGYQSHVAKPVEPAELVAVVVSLVGKSREAGALC